MPVKVITSLEDDTFRLLHELGRDPTRSLRGLAEALSIGKQKCWRKKTELEENNTIWGYTAIVDFEKIGWEMYMMFLQMKPLNHKVVDIIQSRSKEDIDIDEGIVIMDSHLTVGEYDTIITFAARDMKHAKRYYETVRHVYSDHLLNKPVMTQVMFSMKRGGKRNPEIERLRELVPSMMDMEITGGK